MCQFLPLGHVNVVCDINLRHRRSRLDWIPSFQSRSSAWFPGYGSHFHLLDHDLTMFCHWEEEQATADLSSFAFPLWGGGGSCGGERREGGGHLPTFRLNDITSSQQPLLYLLLLLPTVPLFARGPEEITYRWDLDCLYRLYRYRVRQQKPDAQNFNSKETFKKQF